MPAPPPNRTIILQSHHDGAPAPVATCVESVRTWATDAGHAYAFVGNALFDPLPAWFADGVGGNRLIMSDLARLLWLREQLKTYDMAVWIDADVLVFAPERFAICCNGGYGVCRETWVRRGGRGQFLVTQGLHNAVLAFRRGNPLLDFYIHACGEVVRHHGPALEPHALGPDLLARFGDVLGAHVLPNIGLFSPVVTAGIAAGKGRAIHAHMQAAGEPVYAANLCASFLDRPAQRGGLSLRTLQRAIDRLLKTAGAVVNDVAIN